MTVTTQTQFQSPAIRRNGSWLCLRQPSNFVTREHDLLLLDAVPALLTLTSVVDVLPTARSRT